MFCCDDMIRASDLEMIVKREIHEIQDGTILNEVDTEYYLRGAGNGRFIYLGFNYCPFCGRALSRGLWRSEKKR